MKDMLIDDFQYSVQELIFRNKSIIDSLTKYQDSNARVNRSIVKAVTQCGCIRINAKKQDVPEDGSLEEIRKAMIRILMKAVRQLQRPDRKRTRQESLLHCITVQHP